MEDVMKIKTGVGATTISLITLIGIWSISALNALPRAGRIADSGAADQYFSQLQRTGYPDVDFLAVPDDHPVCPHRRAAD